MCVARAYQKYNDILCECACVFICTPEQQKNANAKNTTQKFKKSCLAYNMGSTLHIKLYACISYSVHITDKQQQLQIFEQIKTDQRLNEIRETANLLTFERNI